MPIGRIILKSISESKKLADLQTDGARLLYTWLIPHLDINGCYSGDALVVLRTVFTRLSHRVQTIEGYLCDMERVGLIVRYETNGDLHLHVPDFTDKQPQLYPDKEAKGSIPQPTPEQLQSKSRAYLLKVKTNKVKQSKGKTPKKKLATASGKPPVPWKDRLNKELQEVIEYAHSKNFSLQGSRDWNRKCAYNLLRKKDADDIPLGVERVKKLIDLAVAVRGERYAPQCNDFVALGKKWQDLMAFGEKKMQTKGRIG